MSEQEIHNICEKYNIKNYIINSDGSIDVDGNVNLFNTNLIKIPLKFNRITGYFDCMDNKLTSLEGCPNEVNGGFSCSYNQLTSLEGLSKIIEGSLFCTNNKLTNLKGIETVDRFIFCDGNPLKSLVGYNLSYDKLVCDNKENLIKKHKRSKKLKLIENL